MKANAPKKIYVHVRANKELGTTWHDKKITNSDIEYIRTDAFIDKACDWLSKHAIKYYFNSRKFLGTDELVEDFKIVMRL